jgi:hypothetical protein
MVVGMRFHAKSSMSPPKQPVYEVPKPYVRPTPDAAEQAHAAKLNELLNIRSKNINHILEQRAQAGNEFSASSAIELPPANPRADLLHKELGIDKVVLVKCPFTIDTTPGGFYKHQPKPQPPPPPRTEAFEYSANGNAANALTPDGRLLRGGWAVN